MTAFQQQPLALEPVRNGIFASLDARIRRHLPPLAGRAGNAALVPFLFNLTQLPAALFASVWKIAFSWRSTQSGTYASPQARVWRHLPPLAGRATSTASTSFFSFLQSAASVNNGARATELGDWPKAVLPPSPQHAFGGPSPHLPAVFEGLCRSPFLFPSPMPVRRAP